MRSFFVFVILLSSVGPLPGQVSTADIRALVAQVNAGGDEAVREQLPSLLSTYPNNPGVLYLQALVTREGADAVRTYQSIVDKFPQNEWADDALYKVYQFYYALGLYRTAELKLNQLKTSYPMSPYVDAAAADNAGAAAADQAPTFPAQSAGAVKTPEKVVELPVQTPREKPADSVQEKPRSTVPVSPADPPPVHPEAAIPVRFSLQVGAFTLQANAESQKARFEAMGYSADMMSKVRDTRALFIVLVGDYATYDDARTAAAAVKKKMGVDAIVISR